MNAYELAKDLNIKASMINLGEKIAWGSDSGIMDEAANMLRQQADRIAELSESELNLINQNRELEKNIPHHFGLGHASGFDDASKFYEKKIAELEKQAKEQYGLGYKEAEDDMKTKQSFYEKQSEPIAWYAERQDGEMLFAVSKHEKGLLEDKYDTVIPLYETPQTKPLSDEEIQRETLGMLSPDYVDGFWYGVRWAEAKVRGEK